MNDKDPRSVKGTFNSAVSHAFLFSRFVLAGLVLLYLVSGIFSVSQNEIGVQVRLGRVVNEAVQPGSTTGCPGRLILWSRSLSVKPRPWSLMISKSCQRPGQTSWTPKDLPS